MPNGCDEVSEMPLKTARLDGSDTKLRELSLLSRVGLCRRSWRATRGTRGSLATSAVEALTVAR